MSSTSEDNERTLDLAITEYSQNFWALVPKPPDHEAKTVDIITSPITFDTLAKRPFEELGCATCVLIDRLPKVSAEILRNLDNIEAKMKKYEYAELPPGLAPPIYTL